MRKGTCICHFTHEECGGLITEGSKEDGPVVVMNHSPPCNLNMWDPQVKALENDFRVLGYDTWGHGLSDAPNGPYNLEMLGQDAIGLLNALNIHVVHWVGLSMGGMIGQFMALNYPDRLRSLTLCDTGPVMPDEAQPIWQERIDEAPGGYGGPSPIHN